MSYEVEITGIEPLIEKLEAVGKGNAVRDGLDAISKAVVSHLRIYPPKPPQSTYDRTMKLQRGWTWELSNDGYMSRIGNAVPYAKFVQGRETQMWYHIRTGWKTAEDTLDNKRQSIIDIMKQFLQNVLDGR